MSLEKDFLQYTGNKIPRIIRLFWTIFMLFALYYIVDNLVPDLKTWIHKVK